MADYSNMQEGLVNDDNDARIIDMVFSNPFKKLWDISQFFLFYSSKYIEERGLHHIEKQILDDLLEKVFFPRFDFIRHPIAKKFMNHLYEIKPEINKVNVDKIFNDVQTMGLHPSGDKFIEEYDIFVSTLESKCSYREGTHHLEKSISGADYCCLMEGDVNNDDDPRPIDIIFSEPFKRIYYLSQFFIYSIKPEVDAGQSEEDPANINLHFEYYNILALDHFEKNIIDNLFEHVFFPRFRYIQHPLIKKLCGGRDQENRPVINKNFVDKIFDDIVQLDLHPLESKFTEEFKFFVDELNFKNPYDSNR